MNFQESQIPVRFKGKTLDSMDWGEYKPGTRDIVEEWLEGYEARLKDGVGLLLLGPPGTGKTTIASICGQALLRAGCSVFYVTFAGYVRYQLRMIELRSAWERYEDADAYHDWDVLQERCQQIRNRYEFVIIDDVGKEHTTSTRFAEDENDYLLRHRFDLALPSIVTSNLAPPLWAGKYSDSMASFINEAFVPVLVEADDQRRKR